ncbi:response regulators consisting of a CheY-like receiver domain and a winged-helix DNA-binding domain [Longilinea arvoryzae]|uniref:Response regulators consisting of a CheY-like receiver domain and a winged-helix DNA-binding domain n=1 Tax=Longilinea arvoryzae TaxID=360412 RepID=A0A0S7BMW5_9CHLR|nr:response regulator transcription factor [Longilinea arvoryzae]GAP15339.1 response regulators consisting of a CheY-like receiver domain and a winged-helix DNA-binding domain [Longilinea arvoryzae]
MGKGRILVIDDDPTLNSLIRQSFHAKGYEVITALNGMEGLKLAYRSHPDIILLDIMMPDLDGFETCRRLREISEVPVLMLTAMASEEDLLRGFDAGADDYVKKPFSLRELEVRITAVMKRSANGETGDIAYDDGTLRIDLQRQHVFRDNQRVHVTPTEFRLLSCLIRHRGHVVSHEDLLREVWGDGYLDAVPSLSIYIRYLREKIEENPSEPHYIMTKWGVGYWFSPVLA